MSFINLCIHNMLNFIGRNNLGFMSLWKAISNLCGKATCCVLFNIYIYLFLSLNTGCIYLASWLNKERLRLFTLDNVLSEVYDFWNYRWDNYIMPSITVTFRTQNHSSQLIVWLLNRWRSCLARVILSWVETVRWILTAKTTDCLWCLHVECLLSRTACKAFAYRSDLNSHKQQDPALLQR